MSLPTQLTSELDAVNVLLASIGEDSVNTLVPAEAVDVARAIETLNEIDLAVQAEGWWFNREIRLKLSPQGDGTIPLPSQTLSIQKTYWANGSAVPCKVVERAQKLYDPINHTFTISVPVCIDCVSRQAFADMPEAARRYITIRAARLFQGRSVTSSGVDQITMPEVDRARATLLQLDDQADQHNQVTDNASIQRLILGYGVRRRNS